MPSKIFHISDIHIVSRSYENIKFSFAQLMEKIINVKNYEEECILVIAGDIFDTKTHITTDDIELFNKIIGNFVKYKIKTLIIPGNHDYNINSKCKLDNVSVLLQKTEYPNIVCYADTDVYEKWGIDFHIFSPIDKKIPPEKKSKNLRVAILHETVKSATFDNGIVVEDSRFNPTFLSNKYDIVLLGDIHKPQFLKPNVAYCGSFVQKNKGEDIYHGYILWDLSTKKGTQVFLKLKETYLTISPINNTYESLPNVIPRYIQIRYSNCSNEWIADLARKIKKRYKRSVNVIVDTDKIYYVDDNGEIERKKSAEVVRKTINDPLNQTELITSKLKESGKSDDFIKKVLDYHNKNVISERRAHYTKWSLDYLTWENMFCYGKNNCIDFKQSRGLISILGDNKIGKSTIVDLLIFILFNRTYRGCMADAVNKKFKTGNVTCGFTIGKDKYVIEQWLERTSNRKTHRLYKNGANITKSAIDKTYTFMAFDLGLGTDKEFIKTSVALQNRTFLIDLPRKDRYDHFCKHLEIDIFVEIEKTCRNDKKMLESYIKDIKNDPDFKNDIKMLEDKIGINTEKINSICADLQASKKYLSVTQIQREEHLKFYNPDRTDTELKKELAILKKLVQDIKEKTINLTKNKKLIEEKTNTLKKLNEEYNIIKGKWTTVRDNIKTNKSMPDLVKELKALPKETESPVSDIELMRKHKKLVGILDGNVYNKTNIVQLEIDISVASERISRINEPPVELSFDQLKPMLMEKSKLEKTPEIDTRRLYEKIINTNAKMRDVESILDGMDFSQFSASDIDNEIEKLQNNYSFKGFNFDSDCECCKSNKKIKIKYGDWKKNKKFIKKLQAWKNYLILNQNIKTRKKICAADKKNAARKKRIKYILKQALGREKFNLMLTVDEYGYELKQQRAWKEFIEVKRMIKAADENKRIAKERVRLNKCISYIKAENYIREMTKLSSLIASEQLIFDKCKKIETVVESRAKYLELENIITANIKISQLNPIIEYTKKKIDNFNEEKTRLMVDTQTIKSAIAHKNKLDNILENKESELDIVKSYMKCIDKKKGIPSLVLGSACDILNKKCNQMLTSITDFNVKFEYSPTRGINITTSKILDNVIYYISADMASGFQKFVVDIIMRVVFAKITKCSTPEILFIDEGFGCLDKTNFSTVCNALTYFAANYKSVFIISHIEEIMTYMDGSIKIALNNDLTSCVRVGDIKNNVRVKQELLKERRKVNDIQKKERDERKKKTRQKKSMSAKQKACSIAAAKKMSDEIGLDIFEVGEYNRICKACKKSLRVIKGSLKRHINSKTHLNKMLNYKVPTMKGV